ncbi:MAG TPA: Gfo/Idh/MocA family oxidoreductase [Trebonia sp.]|jgi:predicted dehydrogenase|nr:Gfo/Idh/MocA family oxidoreductase [Trebonia sp.]
MIRVAIAGTGTIAGSHARALAAIPSAELVAAMDTDDGRLGAFGHKYDVPRGYRGLGDLLRHSEPDLVCVPPAAHYGVARTCLEAGVSVLAEKPPVISLREFDGLTRAQGLTADGTPVAPWFATVFQHRFGSGQRRLRSLARSGLLGRPLLAVCHTAWFRDQSYFDVEWRGRWDTEGGGPTMGHGIHQMDMLLDVLGDWTEVSAIARRSARVMDTEDLSLAHVTFASGAVASVVNSVLSPREESYLRFDFEHATVEVTHLYGYEDGDWRITPAKGHEDTVRSAWNAALRGEPGGVGAAGHGTGSDGTGRDRTAGGGPVRSGHAGQLAQVIAALEERRRPPVIPGEARRTMALVAGIYASAFTRRPVTPDDLAPDTPFYGAMNGGLTPRWA